MPQWLKEHGTKIAVACWAALALVGMGSLMAGHWYTLPRPETKSLKLRNALAELREESVAGWQVVHFLYVDCRCSKRILDHLVDDPRPPNVSETVVLVGDEPSFRARAAAMGFRVLVVTAGELAARFGVTGAPIFAVTDAKNKVRYLGGYTNRKQGLDVRDIAIIADLQHDHIAAELPLFGCATSLELQKLLDPLGLKY